jgi:hypothetical protein
MSEARGSRFRSTTPNNCINYRNVSGGGTFPWTLRCDDKEVRSRAEGQLILDDPALADTLMLAGVGAGIMLEQKAAPHL